MAAEIPDGAVIVARAILNSSLWTMRAEDRIVAITCVCLANFRPKRWFDGHKEIQIGRGQFVRSLEGLAEAARVTKKVLRTSLQHLENTGFLARSRAQRYTLYTIPKYDHYQDLTKYSDSAVKHDGHKVGQATGTKRAPDGHRAGNKQECIGKNEEKREEGRAPASASPPPAGAPKDHGDRKAQVARLMSLVEGMTPTLARKSIEMDEKMYGKDPAKHPFPEVLDAKKRKAAEGGKPS